LFAETAVGVEVALLDRDGVITETNAAWDDFARANGADPSLVGVGASYLKVCDAADDPVGNRVARAIRQASDGNLPDPLTVEIPCLSPSGLRWFYLMVSARRDDDGRHLGATVMTWPAAVDGHSVPDRDRPLSVGDLLRAELCRVAIHLRLAARATAPGERSRRLAESAEGVDRAVDLVQAAWPELSPGKDL
jgi:hypothetical protein